MARHPKLSHTVAAGTGGTGPTYSGQIQAYFVEKAPRVVDWMRRMTETVRRLGEARRKRLTDVMRHRTHVTNKHGRTSRVQASSAADVAAANGEAPVADGTALISNPLDAARILEAGHEALGQLLETGGDRVVYRDGRLQVLRPTDEGYWRNTG